MKTQKYLKEKHVINQSNYSDTVVKAVAMIISFGNDDVDRDRDNKNTNEIPKAIVSIHLADCGDDCSNSDDDGSVISFTSTANDRRTSDNNDLPGAEAPAVNSKFRNDNINENVMTGDNDDDDNNKAITMLGDNEDGNSEGKVSVSENDNTNSTTNPTDRDPL